MERLLDSTVAGLSPETRRALLDDAFRAFRAEAQNLLLGLAYADAPAPPGGADLDLFMLSSRLLAPPAGNGAWRAAWEQLLDTLSARQLRSLGADVTIHLVAELWYMERAEVGPDAGPLRRAGAPCPAWGEILPILGASTPAALWRRAADELGRLGPELPLAARRHLDEVCRALREEAARTGVVLTRLAAADAAGGSFESLPPVPVRGATGWGVHVRIDPTLDSAWLVVARRVALEPAEARKLAIAVSMRIGEAEHRCAIAAESESVTWYLDGSPASAVVITAAVDELA